MSPCRVGVLGLGVGARHLKSYALLPDVEIAAVADLSLPLAREQAERYHARAYSDPLEMLRREHLHAVSICTPPASHRELTQAAAAAGVHVLCEKPMAPRLTDCDAMIAACAQAGVTLMIAQKKRFHPLVQRLRTLCAGELGAIRWAVVKYALGRVPKEWFWDEADGGGPVLENSVHAVDLLRFLIGEVSTVHAEGGNLFNPDRRPQIDCACCSLRFANGAMAALGLGQASEWAYASEFFFFACDGGEARFDGPFDRPRRWWLALRGDPSAGREEMVADDDCFDAEIGHFLHCVRSGETPAVTGESARGSVAVCLAIKQSARSGGPVRVAP